MGGHKRMKGAETLGPFDFGPYPFSFNEVKQFIFIRHGEKPDKEDMTDNLSPKGEFRANNLYRVFGPGNTPAGYGTPDVIYAMKAAGDGDASNRPFQTVQPLATSLGMNPRMGQRTPPAGGVNVFDNQYTATQHGELKDDVEAHCSNGAPYKGKTLMFCWEHKNIPYIVAKFGLAADDELTWGLNPFAGEDDNENFDAIWVFTPGNSSFEVYQEFSISGDDPSNFAVETPDGGYGTAVYSGPIPKDG